MEENPLTRLANRARNKFNKNNASQNEIPVKRRFCAEYVFKKIDDKKEQRENYEKIFKIYQDDPDSINVIGKLIDKKIYQNLSEPEKDRYITNLTNKFLNVIKK